MLKLLDKESRLLLLQQASPDVQELYGNEENGASISAVAESLNITDDDAYDTLALTIGDIILGSYDRAYLGALLKDRLGFTDDQVAVVEMGVRDLLDKVPKASTLLASPATPAETTPAASFTNTAQAEENEVRSLRTFADDVRQSRAHGYGAFQSPEAEAGDDTPLYRSSQEDVLGK